VLVCACVRERESSRAPLTQRERERERERETERECASDSVRVGDSAMGQGSFGSAFADTGVVVAETRARV